MHRLIHLTAISSALFLSSCGDDNTSEGTAASESVSKAVDSQIPLYYKVLEVTAKETEQQFFGKEGVISQFAAKVELTEDLYREEGSGSHYLSMGGERLSEEFDEAKALRDRIMLVKVASAGEQITLYGELAQSVKADGTRSVEHFKFEKTAGKPLSTFDKTRTLIVDSAESKAFIESARQEHAAAIQAQKDAQAAKIKAAEEKKAAELARKQAEKDAIQKRSDDYLAKIADIFTVGKTYQGVFKSKVPERVELQVLEYDSKLHFGIVKITSKENPLYIEMKFSLSSKQTSTRIIWSLTGTQLSSSDITKEIKNKSKLASGASYGSGLTIRSISTEEDRFTLDTAYGKLEYSLD